MLKILEKYIGKLLLTTVFLVTAIIGFLAFLISFVDSTRHLGDGTFTLSVLFKYCLLNTPSLVVTVFPICVLLGTVAGLSILAKNSELLVLQSAGISKAGVIITALKTIFPLIVIVCLIGEFVGPKLNQRAEQLYSSHVNGGAVTQSFGATWFREGNYYIGMQHILSDGQVGLTVRYQVKDGKILSLQRAQSGKYTDGKWLMNNVDEYQYLSSHIEHKFYKEQTWTLSFSPEKIEVISASKPNQNVSSLYDYVKYLEQNSQNSSQYRYALYSKLISPFVMVVMIFLGASCVFGSTRSFPISTRIVIGVGFGFIFYVFSELFAPSTLIYGVYPSIAAILPTLIFGGISMYLLNRRM